MAVLIRELGFLRKYWRRVILAYLAVFGAAGFSVATPWIIKTAIDVGLAQSDPSILIVSGVLVILAALFRGACGFAQTYLGEYLSQAVAYDIRNAIYDHLQRISYAYHDRQQTGQLMSRATADVEAVRMFIFMGALRFVFIAVMILASCCLLLSLNWRLTALVFAILPIVGFRALSTSIQLRPQWRAIQEAIAALGTILQENFSGVRVVKAFGREEFEERKYGAKAQEVRLLNYNANRIQSFNSSLLSFIQVVIIAVVLWYGGSEVIAGQLTLGGLVAFTAYLTMLTMPVRALGWMANVFARAISSGERIFEILDTQSAVQERPDAVELTDVQGLVRFEDVSFAYDRPVADSLTAFSPVLRHVDIAAQPGQVIALLGATGSGKSTVVNLIPRFYDVTGGRITIDGIDVRDVALVSLRRNVGIVHQDVFIFSDTIRNNIAYGAVGASQQDIEVAAKTARLHEYIVGLPQGYETWVGERGITLSGGQKQRLAIARTLLTDPKVLILDDSTSSVDMETEYLIQQALATLMVGRTTFVIAQRLRTVLHADTIVVLDDGEIAERGTHRELLEQGGLYREIYDLQLRGQEEQAAGFARLATM